jgi:hypothetical protein
MASGLLSAIKSKLSKRVPPPISGDAIAKAETVLGFAPPPLLREVYLEVGNGGFGPGLGLLTLTEVVDQYLQNRGDYPDESGWKWPEGVLQFCSWGCAKYSCVDCLQTPFAVSSFEYVQGSMESSFIPTSDSLEKWFRDWLAGNEVFESAYEFDPTSDREIINPFTKEPMVIKGKKPRRR